jgi:hypothetical protein
VAKSVSDGWLPETRHGVVSMIAVTLLCLNGHFCPAFTLNRETITSADAKIVWFNRSLSRGVAIPTRVQNRT